MSSIENVSTDKIKANPFRMLEKYPYSEEKLAALQSSIEATGFWEGVIARQNNDEFQLAFGHHRVEAARLVGLKTVPLIIRQLTDEQMLQLMGRENLEDYRTSFLVLLETWEAADGFLPSQDGNSPQPVKVAELLGWTEIRDGKNIQLSNTARATNGALKLIKAGYHTHADFDGLHMTAVRHLVDRAQSLIKQSTEVAKSQNHKPEVLEKAKDQIARAVTKTANQVREGKLATDKITHTLDVNVYEFAHAEAKPRDPNFSVIGKQIAASIDKMLESDATGEKLDKIKQLIPHIENAEDKKIILQIETALALLAERVAMRQKELSLKKADASPLKLLKGA
jgi:hypothetical protein